jgi:hypothetical protein
VVYYPNIQLLAGIYNINVGIDSVTPSNRISKFKLGAIDLITANGGGDGGSQTGGSSATITNGIEHIVSGSTTEYYAIFTSGSGSISFPVNTTISFVVIGGGGGGGGSAMGSRGGGGGGAGQYLTGSNIAINAGTVIIFL